MVHSFSGSSKGVASCSSRTLIRLKAPDRSALSWSTVSAKDPINKFISFIVIFPLLLLVFFALERECVYGRGERKFFGLIGYRITVPSYAMPKASAGLGECIHLVVKELQPLRHFGIRVGSERELVPCPQEGYSRVRFGVAPPFRAPLPRGVIAQVPIPVVSDVPFSKICRVFKDCFHHFSFR